MNQSGELFQTEELYEMFNTSFLPKLQEFARRAKETRLPEKDVKFFHVNMLLQFSELEEPLTYQMIQDKIQMQLQPVTQEDLDRDNEDTQKDS